MENENYRNFSDDEMNDKEFIEKQGLIQVIEFDKKLEQESSNDNDSFRNQTQQPKTNETFYQEEQQVQPSQPTQVNQQALVPYQQRQLQTPQSNIYSSNVHEPCVPFNYNAIASAGLHINDAMEINKAAINSHLKII